MEPSSELKLEEYRSLRDEHLKNRTLIFERPIIVIGLVAAVLGYLYDSEICAFLFFMSIIVLSFNLWFIGNRMQSDARIVAYIQLVFEPGSSIQWVGWENALAKYRSWMASQGHSERQKMEANFRHTSPDQSFRFYPAIWSLHVFVVAGMLAATIFRCCTSPGAQEYVAVATAYFSYLSFASLAPWHLNPGYRTGIYKMEEGLPSQRVDNQVWSARPSLFPSLRPAPR